MTEQPDMLQDGEEMDKDTGEVLPPIRLRDKIEEIKRELGMRKQVYPGLIERKKLNRTQANHYYRIMRAILRDYEERGGSLGGGT